MPTDRDAGRGQSISRFAPLAIVDVAHDVRFTGTYAGAVEIAGALVRLAKFVGAVVDAVAGPTRTIFVTVIAALFPIRDLPGYGNVV